MVPAALDVGVCPVRAANVFSDFPSQAMLSTATYAAHSEHVIATADDAFCEQQQHWLRPTLVTAPRTSTRRQETDR
jgi:hypothetical protein